MIEAISECASCFKEFDKDDLWVVTEWENPMYERGDALCVPCSERRRVDNGDWTLREWEKNVAS